jgi:hypothetical protein
VAVAVAATMQALTTEKLAAQVAAQLQLVHPLEVLALQHLVKALQVVLVQPMMQLTETVAVAVALVQLVETLALLELKLLQSVA